MSEKAPGHHAHRVRGMSAILPKASEFLHHRETSFSANSRLLMQCSKEGRVRHSITSPARRGIEVGTSIPWALASLPFKEITQKATLGFKPMASSVCCFRSISQRVHGNRPKKNLLARS